MAAKPSWVPSENGNVPNGAVIAGTSDGDEVYVARVHHEGKWIPGSLIKRKKKCVIAWDGDHVSKRKYEVLCNCNVTWRIITSEFKIPKNALCLDVSGQGCEQIFIGRKNIDVIIGYVKEKSGLLCAPLDEEIYHFDEYEILIVPNEEMEILYKQTRDCLRKNNSATKIGPIKSDHRKAASLEEIFDESSSQEFITKLEYTDLSSISESSDCESISESVNSRENSKYTSKKEIKTQENSSANFNNHHHRRYKNSEKKTNCSEEQEYNDEDDDKQNRTAKYYRPSKKFSGRNEHEHRQENYSDKYKNTNYLDSYDSDDGSVGYEKQKNRRQTRKRCDSSVPRQGGGHSSRHQEQGTWIAAQDGDYPPDAIIGGKNHLGDIFVARIKYKDALLPGKLIPEYKHCYASYNGEEIRKKRYEVLCDLTNEEWIEMGADEDIPKNAISGGYNKRGEEVFIGRVKFGSSYILGKIDERRGKFYCYTLFRKSEEKHDRFEILIQNPNNSSLMKVFFNKIAKQLHSIVNPQSTGTNSENSNESWEKEENGAVPSGAVVGGNNKMGDIFVARAEHEGMILPGKLIPGFGHCYVSWQGGEVRKNKYEVLCNCEAMWVKMTVRNNRVSFPRNAIPGGVTNNGECIYIGRIHHKEGNTITCGRVDIKTGICTVVFGKKEHTFEMYEILVLALPDSPTKGIDARLISNKQSKSKKTQKKTIKGLQLTPLNKTDTDYISVANLMNSTIKTHVGNKGGVFTKYNIIKIEKIKNELLQKRYQHRLNIIKQENSGNGNVSTLFHGSPTWKQIIDTGFDERTSNVSGMFGAGIYFAEHSSKSNQYIFGFSTGNNCPQHQNNNCHLCERTLILCNVALGKTSLQNSGNKISHAPPGHHSVTGVTGLNLQFEEYVVYRGEQVLPTHVITYKIEK